MGARKGAKTRRDGGCVKLHAEERSEKKELLVSIKSQKEKLAVFVDASKTTVCDELNES